MTACPRNKPGLGLIPLAPVGIRQPWGTRYKKLTRDRYKSDLLNDHGSPIGVELGITTAWRLIRLQADRLTLNEAGGWPMKTQNGSEDDAHV